MARRSKGWWLGLPLLALVGLAALGTAWWTLSLWQQGAALQTSLARVTESVASPDDVAALDSDLVRLKEDIQAFQERLRPLRLVHGVPFLGREARAVEELAAASGAGVAAARDVVQGVASLRGLLDPGAFDAGAIGEADRAFARAEGELVSLGGPLPRLPALRERYRAAQEAWGQLELLVHWGQESTALLLALADVEGAVASGDWLSPGLGDALSRVRERVPVVRQHTQQVRQAFPALSQDLDRFTVTLDAVGMIADGAIVGLEVLRPAVDLLKAPEASLLHNGQLMAQVLAVLAEGQAALYEAAGHIEDGLQGLTFAPDEWRQRLGEAQAAFRLLADVAPVAPSLVGLDGPRKYLVLGQTADELRATGGFISTVWVVTFQGGELAEVRYLDAVEVDDMNHLAFYPVPPAPLKNYMNACCWLLRDISWGPDFPSTARLAQEVYQLGQAEQVDGVVALNQWTLQEVVEFLGGLPSPEDGSRILPEEFMVFLQEKTDQQGRGYARLLMPLLLEEMEGQFVPDRFMALGSLVRDLFRQKLLMLSVNDETVQGVLHQLGWDGSVADTEADYLMVVDSNVGWSKVDRNIVRSLSYQVALQPQGRSLATLSLEYRNASGPEASGCQAQWMSRGRTYVQQMQACYWDYLRVYLPPESILAHADPMPLPPGAIYALTGGMAGEETLEVSSAHGKTVLGGLKVVPPGEVVEQSFLYELPQGVVQRQGDSFKYALTLQKQPGVLRRDVRLVVTLPQGYRIDEATPSPQQVGPGRVAWQFSLLQDVHIELLFSP